MHSLRTYYGMLLEELVDAIGDAENAGWHHLPPGDVRAAHYRRLGTWALALDERVKWYDNAKGRAAKYPESAKARSQVDRLQHPADGYNGVSGSYPAK